jgi:hypothetical protein
LRANFLRLHFQFIMAGDLRSTYDYFMLTCGPLPIEDWVVRGREALSEFDADAAYVATNGSAKHRQPADLSEA